jgi:hypothetical protein
MTLDCEVMTMEDVEILIKGHIDRHWSEWLGGLQTTHVEQDKSLLTGAITDQAMLHGILTKLRDLDLKIISVNLQEGEYHE